MYLVRKKPDGYLLSGAVRVRPVRYYAITESFVPEDETSSEESTSSSSEETPCVKCGKTTVHFHNDKPPPLPFTETQHMTRSQRRRNRRKRDK